MASIARRCLVLLQVGLLTASLVLPAAALAADPDPSVDQGPVPTESSPPDPSPEGGPSSTPAPTDAPVLPDPTPAPSESQAPPPAIASDKDDYAPGELVTLAGSG